MKGGLLLAGALAIALTGASPAPAQQSADTSGVAVALFRHLRGEIPPGRAAVDPEPFCAPRLVGWRCSERIRAVTQQLDLSLNAREFTLVCTSGPASCRLATVRALISFEGVQIDSRAGRARVTANLWWRTGAGMSPVTHQTRRMTLTRSGQEWTVTDPGG